MRRDGKPPSIWNVTALAAVLAIGATVIGCTAVALLALAF